MARYCGTCYLEAEPGDEKCRRCGGEFEPYDITWLIILAMLCCAAVFGGIVEYFLNR